jgi:Flp pilus assembly protein TadB
MTAIELILPLLAITGAVIALYSWRSARLKQLCINRVRASLSAMGAVPQAPQEAAIKPFPPRYLFAGPLAGLVIAATVYWFSGLPSPFAVAAGLMIGVLVGLVEIFLAESKTAAMEAQLADSIDLMVGALQAGAALLKAFDAALAEARQPFRSELVELTGRIRLGESPQAAINALAVRVPLETFRLFCVSLAVHWETGGALSSSLLGVGRTIRDRIETARRIRAQSAEGQVSVVAVLLISYGLGAIMYNANPEPMVDFLFSPIGAYIASSVISLQAVGILWIARMSAMKY